MTRHRTESTGMKTEGVFVLVEASKLRLNDKFLKHRPRTATEHNFKELLVEIIKSNPKDFWRPKYDPSLAEDGTGICYIPGKEPAIGCSYIQWENMAKAFNPKRHSRLGTKEEYVAFLGVIIKNLVWAGWSIKDAWHAVCSDPIKLGHYRNSPHSKENFEPTGSRRILEFCDLANTYKLLAIDHNTGNSWAAGGCYFNYSRYNPLTDLLPIKDNLDVQQFNCVGWVVME